MAHPAASTSAVPAPLAALQARSTRPPAIPPARVPFFGSAAQPEIVRANQKDLYYLSQLTDKFEDVFRGLLGTRWLQKWGKELNQGSRVAYFGLTTLLGSQTLGEEYCDIMQYAVTSRKPPSARRRAALLSLQILLPYLLARLYSHIRRNLLARHLLLTSTPSSSLDDLFSSVPPPVVKKSLQTRMVDRLAGMAENSPTFDNLIEDYLRSTHLAIFYLYGRYYHLSKRLAGIRFISNQSKRSIGGTGPGAPPSSYEVLGVLMAVQIVVRISLALFRRRIPPQDPSTSSDATSLRRKKVGGRFKVDEMELGERIFDPEDPEDASDYPIEGEGGVEKRCTLCLGGRRDETATECGHVFCWECIVGWTREKPECPLCRQAIKLSTLLPLYNL